VEQLAFSRLWTGKSEVIVSTVSIIGKWSAVKVETGVDKRILFGWEEEGETCPWQPIRVSGDFSDDLFVGDGWFKEKHTESENIDTEKLAQAPSDAMEVDVPEAEHKLDFEECDNVMTDNEEDNPEGADDGQEAVAQGSSVLTFAGINRFLLDQAIPSDVSRNVAESMEFLPYRLEALKGVRALMESSGNNNLQKRAIFKAMAPRVISLIDCDKIFGIDRSESETKDPPVVTARAIDCLAAFFWHGMGSISDLEEMPFCNILNLAQLLSTAGGGKQPAWTVREAAWRCAASLASHCHSCTLRDHKVVSILVEGAFQAQKDRKFWKVRIAGLKLLLSLVTRAGDRAIASATQNAEELLFLESMLPRKEAILKLAKDSLRDPEASVTALASEMIAIISWWP